MLSEAVFYSILEVLLEEYPFKVCVRKEKPAAHFNVYLPDTEITISISSMFGKAVIIAQKAGAIILARTIKTGYRDVEIIGIIEDILIQSA